MLSFSTVDVMLRCSAARLAEAFRPNASASISANSSVASARSLASKSRGSAATIPEVFCSATESASAVLFAAATRSVRSDSTAVSIVAAALLRRPLSARAISPVAASTSAAQPCAVASWSASSCLARSATLCSISAIAPLSPVLATLKNAV